VSVLVYKEVFDALAAGDRTTEEAIAGHIGTRPDYDKHHVHPFDTSLGYTLRSFVLNLTNQMATRTAEFEAICQTGGNAGFAGYATMFRAILNHDEEQAQSGLLEIARGVKSLSKRGGVFSLREDSVLCVWGVGMANLARRRGLKVKGVEPLIPETLLLDQV
jgi:hypothetical protein